MAASSGAVNSPTRKETLSRPGQPTAWIPGRVETRRRDGLPHSGRPEEDVLRHAVLDHEAIVTAVSKGRRGHAVDRRGPRLDHPLQVTSGWRSTGRFAASTCTADARC